jgi:hypothetical protein
MTADLPSRDPIKALRLKSLTTLEELAGKPTKPKA